jgi:hypothetical protein
MQSVGVRQGDNMVPVLFLFLMSAAAETLKIEWEQAGIKVLTVAHSPNEDLATRCLRGCTPKMYNSCKLTAYEIFQLLYVNDSAFPFPTWSDLIKGLALVHSHLARFGLEVHIGRGSESSKTECVFFPPPQFFNDKLNPPSLTNDENNNNLWLTNINHCMQHIMLSWRTRIGTSPHCKRCCQVQFTSRNSTDWNSQWLCYLFPEIQVPWITNFIQPLQQQRH